MLYRYEKETNDIIMQKHSLLKAPTVLVSSSMYEGVDLPGELSRFMIIVKMPWLSLADKRIKKMSEINDDWYQLKLWEKFIQACGRSTRSDDDAADTWICDNKFWFWFSKAKTKGWIPQYFIDRVKKI
jgi:Rad3-related DNA helicase